MDLETDPTATSTALVHQPDQGEPGRLWEDVALQKVWLASQKRKWRTLALLGATKSVDTMRLAEIFAKLAWSFTGQPSCVFDLRDLTPRLVEYHQREIAAQVEGGARVFIALRSTVDNPTAIPLARAADGVLLAIDLGEARFKIADQIVAEVGRDRILGALVLRPEAKKGKRAPNGR
jgi:hypothetical protein